MGVNYSTNIVRSGLILHLDAANTKSYPGSGTTWTDLSGNGNHFTLFNSPFFGGNYFNFSGVNEYARSVSTLDLSSYNSVTIEVAFAANVDNSLVKMIYEHSGNWNTNTSGFGLYGNSSGNALYVANSQHTNHRLGSGAVNYSAVVSTQVGVHTNIFSKIVDSSGRNAFVNGAEVAFALGSKTTGTYSSFRNDNLFLASRNGTSEFGNCKLYYLLIYGRKLSATEVKQNFNAFRGRYGL